MLRALATQLPLSFLTHRLGCCGTWEMAPRGLSRRPGSKAGVPGHPWPQRESRGAEAWSRPDPRPLLSMVKLRLGPGLTPPGAELPVFHGGRGGGILPLSLFCHSIHPWSRAPNHRPPLAWASSRRPRYLGHLHPRQDPPPNKTPARVSTPAAPDSPCHEGWNFPALLNAQHPKDHLQLWAQPLPVPRCRPGEGDPDRGHPACLRPPGSRRRWVTWKREGSQAPWKWFCSGEGLHPLTLPSLPPRSRSWEPGPGTAPGEGHC